MASGIGLIVGASDSFVGDGMVGGSLTAGGTVNYTLTCASGSYSISGQALLFKRGYTLTCSAGIYSVSGQNLLFKRGYTLDCEAGAYAISGQDLTFVYTPGSGTINYTLTCEAGAYVISGQSLNFNVTQASTLFGGVAHFSRLNEENQRRKSTVKTPVSEQTQETVHEIVLEVAKAVLTNSDIEQRQALKEALQAQQIAFKAAYFEELKSQLIKEYMLAAEYRRIAIKNEEEAIVFMMMALV